VAKKARKPHRIKPEKPPEPPENKKESAAVVAKERARKPQRSPQQFNN